MQYEKFIQRVEEKLGPGQLEGSDPAQTELAVNATLSTLGERLEGGAAQSLAAQLPGGAREALESKAGERAEDFNLTEFYQRIAEKEGSDVSTATIHAAAVMQTVDEAVTTGEISDVLSQLPNEFGGLLRS